MMKLIVLSSVVAQTSFDDLCSEGRITSQFQNQKFYHLLLSGLRSSASDKIHVISHFPINKSDWKRVYHKDEDESGVIYHYINFHDIPFLHHISKFVKSYFLLKRLHSDDSVLICNAMNYELLFASLFIRKRTRIPLIAVVADVPGHRSNASCIQKKGMKSFAMEAVSKLNLWAIKQSDGFVLLTKYMNDIVNPLNKPNIIIEGIADSGMVKHTNSFLKKESRNVMMYAGGLHEEYGIRLLLEAFTTINPQDWNLVLYGDGNFRDAIQQYSKHFPNVIYKGIASNSTIIDEQLKARVLLNPRPTESDFVKYSFPSKVMECMVSGTPLLTTKIPGMPDEYLPFVYLIENENPQGYIDALKYIMSIPMEELHSKGEEAKEFILSQKNNNFQAKKVFDFIKLFRQP